MAIPLLAGIGSAVFAGLRKFFFSKKGIFGLLAIIGINIVTWTGLTLITNAIASSLEATTFPPGTMGNFAMNFILLSGLSDYASIVLGALSIKLTLAATKIRFQPTQMNLPF